MRVPSIGSILRGEAVARRDRHPPHWGWGAAEKRNLAIALRLDLPEPDPGGMHSIGAEPIEFIFWGVIATSGAITALLESRISSGLRIAHFVARMKSGFRNSSR